MADALITQQQGVPPEGGWGSDGIRIVTTKALTTTGGVVWQAAHRCAAYLAAEAQSLGLTRPGVRVLELGAGCGLLGMLVAHNCPCAGEVCLTERSFGGALEHLQLNVAANAGLPGPGRICSVRACDWTHLLDPASAQAAAELAASASPATGCAGGVRAQPAGPPAPQQGPAQQQGAGPTPRELADLAALLSTRWDLIIGSDLCYDVAGARALPRVLAALMPPGRAGCCMVMAHTKHRFDAIDVELFEQLAAAGLEAREVSEAGQLAPPSPPPFSELFPELRCAVFRIARPGQ